MASQSIEQPNIFATKKQFGKTAEEFQPAETSDLPEKKRCEIKDIYVVPIVRLAFYGFIASIPFETVNLGIPTEITVITLALLLLSLVFQIPLCLKKPPTAFWLFFLYLIIFTIPVYTSVPKIYFEEAKWQLIVFAQLVLMSWVAFNIMKSERAARGALLTLAISCTLLAFLQQIGVSEVASDTGSRSERVSAFGFHPNNLARILSLGFLALAGLTYGLRKSFFKSHLMVYAAIALLGLAVVQTGSRGGLLALGGGLLVFTLKRGAVSAKFRNAAVVLIGISFFLALVMQSEASRSRFESAIEDGNLARREKIYPEAWKMFTEKPLFGWGAKSSEYELGARLAHVDEDSKNPHNLILFVLLSSGLIGLVPLMGGIFLTAKTAWKARDGIRGVLPLAMLMTVLIANMSGVWLHNKMHWFVMAYVLSSPIMFKRIGSTKQKNDVNRPGFSY